MSLRLLSRKKIKLPIPNEYSKNYGTRKFFCLFIFFSIIVLIRCEEMMFSTVCIIFLLLFCFSSPLKKIILLHNKIRFYYKIKCTVVENFSCFILLEEAKKPLNNNFKGQYLCSRFGYAIEVFPSDKVKQVSSSNKNLNIYIYH